MIANCHPSRFAKAHGLCKSCYDRYLKQVNPGYKARQVANNRRWCVSHPAEWQAIRDRRKAKLKADPLYRRERDLMKKYGMTLSDYDALLASQNGCCAICFRQPGKIPLHVDHNHATGVVRGILCHQCNWYLGTVEQDPGVLHRIQSYLDKDGHE